MWILRSITPGNSDLLFRLLPGTFKTMGRAAGADFIVDAALVSRVHCRFSLSHGNELLVEDLGSTNGTFVNGDKIAQQALRSGDKIAVGRVEFLATEQSTERTNGRADDQST